MALIQFILVSCFLYSQFLRKQKKINHSEKKKKNIAPPDYALLLKNSKSKYDVKNNFIYTKEDIITTDNYYNFVQKLLHLNTPEITKTEDGKDKILYIKSDILFEPSNTYLWRNSILQKFFPTHVIISGHSDNSITRELIESKNRELIESKNRELIESKNTGINPKKKIKYWCGINMDIDISNNNRELLKMQEDGLFPKIIQLPLGITNNTNESDLHNISGNCDMMIYVFQNFKKERKNTVYLNFSVETYSSERKHVYNLFCNKPWVTVDKSVFTFQGRECFLRQLRNHDFVLCPRGNGIDTHRLWETLYMGSFPIVKKTRAFSQFIEENDLPICWINEWEDVTLEFLSKEYERLTNPSNNWNYNKLKMSYWEKIIASCLLL
jgi:hypothetical protein